MQRLRAGGLRLVERLLGPRLWQEVRAHAHPERHVVLEIAPLSNPGQRVAVFGIGALGFIGIPVSLLTPLLPTTPFVLITLVCCARLSGRFRRWLLSLELSKAALSAIYTRPQKPFVYLRKLIHFLLGNPIVYPAGASVEALSPSVEGADHFAHGAV